MAIEQGASFLALFSTNVVVTMVPRVRIYATLVSFSEDQTVVTHRLSTVSTLYTIDVARTLWVMVRIYVVLFSSEDI